MKKKYSFVIIIALLIAVLTGCGEIETKNSRLSIVTTVFPEYDWVLNILGEKAADADVTLLLDNGVDIHSYQPTTEDIVKISTCNVFIYVGGESDNWVKDALRGSANSDMIVINLLETLGEDAKEEEEVEGMQHEEHDHDEHDHEETDHEEHDHDEHDHEEAEHEEHDDEPEFDEHVWLSLKNAEKLCKEIAVRLGEADNANRETYSLNAADYIVKLRALDSKYADAVRNGRVNTLLFGDRFPFRYLTDDYGLNYYAAFAGCSAETEASFETIVFLANKVDELGLNAIIRLETSDGKIAQTIKDNTKEKNQVILQLDSLQSTTADDLKNGTTYISVMEKNLEAIIEALK